MYFRTPCYPQIYFSAFRSFPCPHRHYHSHVPSRHACRISWETLESLSLCLVPSLLFYRVWIPYHRPVLHSRLLLTSIKIAPHGLLPLSIPSTHLENLSPNSSLTHYTPSPTSVNQYPLSGFSQLNLQNMAQDNQHLTYFSTLT